MPPWPYIWESVMTELKITKRYPTFPDSTTPKGALPTAKAAQACWFYYILAQKQKERVGRGPEDQILTVETGKDSEVLWLDKHYLQQARSIALLYDVGVEDMFQYWPEVTREAKRLDLPAPHIEYMNPKRFLI